MKREEVVVGIAQAETSGPPALLVSYALGSCVGICLYDRRTSLAGLAHILLPSYENAVRRENRYKFADTGCEDLMGQMVSLGVRRESLVAKIAGGASMFRTGGDLDGIGDKNVQAVRMALGRLKIPILAEDVGGSFGRTILFDPATGILTVRAVNQKIREI